MRDMFDEFMEELRRRQAELEGRDPDAPKDEDGGPDQPEEGSADKSDEVPEEAAGAAGHEEEARDEEATEEEPIPLGGPDEGRTRRGPRRRGAGGPRRRPRPPRSGPRPGRPSGAWRG